MSKAFLAIVLFSAISLSVKAQDYDTIKTYDVFLEAINRGFYMDYKVNGQLVSAETYDNYKMHWNAAYACKPCYLVTLDAYDHVEHFALQYENCLVGVYREFYPEGGLKVQGQYKENPTNDWDKLGERDLCNIRTGKWNYFSEQGAQNKVEFYEDGKLLTASDFDKEKVVERNQFYKQKNEQEETIEQNSPEEENESVKPAKVPLRDKIKVRFTRDDNPND